MTLARAEEVFTVGFQAAQLPVLKFKIVGNAVKLLLGLGLGEHGIGFVYDLPMQPVVKGGVVRVQAEKRHIISEGPCRPLDCRPTFQIGALPVRIGAGILICHIIQHQIFDNGHIMIVQFPNSRFAF